MLNYLLFLKIVLAISLTLNSMTWYFILIFEKNLIGIHLTIAQFYTAWNYSLRGLGAIEPNSVFFLAPFEAAWIELVLG